MHTRRAAQRIIEFYPAKELIVISKPNTEKVLKVDSQSLQPQETTKQALSFDMNSFNIRFTVDAIYGIVKLIHDSFFIVVEKSENIAEILDRPIYTVKRFKFIPIKANLSNRYNSNSDDGISKQDSKFIEIFQSVFEKGGFYFSHEYDLTNSMQRLVKAGFDDMKIDPRFFINSCFLKTFLHAHINFLGFISPFIYGFIDQKNGLLRDKGKNLSFTLISRKDINRLGVRFYSRGANFDGNVSNFVETEQILNFSKGFDKEGGSELDNKIFSLVQIRGSIPLIWNQQPILTYNPPLNIHRDNQKHEKTYRLHFQKMTELYNKIQIVNLIDKKKSQYKIGSKFASMHQKVCEENNEQYRESVDFVWFDYHHECRKMKVENLSKLLAQIETSLKQNKWFECKYAKTFVNSKEELGESIYEFSVLREQTGVVRTNCMDNLDRTNVVQSVFARNNILTILNQYKLSSFSSNPFQALPCDFESNFRHVWTDNADRLSILYSGTPALKTDFTRTGKRGYVGMFWDGYHSVKRYLINQIIHSEYQNSLDFVTGNLKPKQNMNYSPGNGKLIRRGFSEELS